MAKATDTPLTPVTTDSTAPLRRLRLAPLSLIAPPISWFLIFLARRIADAPFNDPASNVMVAMLWIGGLITLLGFVLAVLALRARSSESRPLSIISVILNFINLVFYLLIGLLALLLSV